MKKPSREDELKLLAEARKLVQNDTVAEEVGQWLEKNVSEGEKYDVTSAMWGALGLMPDAKPNEKETYSTKAPPKELVAMLMAGMMRCTPTSCQHVWSKFGIVRRVFLAPRICSCEDCILLFQKNFKEHDESKAHAGECDLCLTQGHKMFHKLTLSFNGAIYHGDVCPACVKLTNG